MGPAYVAFQQTPLQTFWPAVVGAIAIPEIFSIFTFKEPDSEGNFWLDFWAIKEGRTPGDFNFDPLGLKPTNDQEFKEMQTKELNNGRLAMIAAAHDRARVGGWQENFGLELADFLK